MNFNLKFNVDNIRTYIKKKNSMLIISEHILKKKKTSVHKPRERRMDTSMQLTIALSCTEPHSVSFSQMKEQRSCYSLICTCPRLVGDITNTAIDDQIYVMVAIAFNLKDIPSKVIDSIHWYHKDAIL